MDALGVSRHLRLESRSGRLPAAGSTDRPVLVEEVPARRASYTVGQVASDRCVIAERARYELRPAENAEGVVCDVAASIDRHCDHIKLLVVCRGCFRRKVRERRGELESSDAGTNAEYEPPHDTTLPRRRELAIGTYALRATIVFGHDAEVTWRWLTEVDAGAWLSAEIGDFARNVGSIVPARFEQYARVFHPIVEGPSRRWADVAALNGRIAHAEMQYHLIDPAHGETPYIDDVVSVGSLPRDELLALTALLDGHTARDEPCYFAVWDGFGQLHGGSAWSQLTRDGRAAHLPGLVPQEVLAGPRLRLPSRSYLLALGVLSDVVVIFDELHDQSPNLWWPESGRWCVATEIDFGWTYVGGSHDLVDDLLAHEDLEAMRTQPGHGVTFASDLLNAALNN